MTTAPCGCPVHPGRHITDQERHDAYHRLVEQQTGIAYGTPIDAASLRQARGLRTIGLPTSTVLDDRAVASGKRRSSPEQYREAKAREEHRALPAAVGPLLPGGAAPAPEEPDAPEGGVSSSLRTRGWQRKGPRCPHGVDRARVYCPPCGPL